MSDFKITKGPAFAGDQFEETMLRKAGPKGGGWHPIPGGKKKGGLRRRHAGGWEYYYPHPDGNGKPGKKVKKKSKKDAKYRQWLAGIRKDTGRDAAARLGEEHARMLFQSGASSSDVMTALEDAGAFQPGKKVKKKSRPPIDWDVSGFAKKSIKLIDGSRVRFSKDMLRAKVTLPSGKTHQIKSFLPMHPDHFEGVSGPDLIGPADPGNVGEARAARASSSAKKLGKSEDEFDDLLRMRKALFSVEDLKSAPRRLPSAEESRNFQAMTRRRALAKKKAASQKSGAKSGGGWEAIPGGKKGGQRRRKAGGGYEYRYDIQKYKMRVTGATEESARSQAERTTKGIEAAADICKMTPPVCEGNLGIERKDMPQFDEEANPNVIQEYLDSFRKQGVKVTDKRMAVGQLKATQKEINAEKVKGMVEAHEKHLKGEGKWSPGKGAIVVSSDGYVLDGHHRWAALLDHDPANEMHVHHVDASIRDLLARSEQFHREGRGVKKAGFSAPSLGVKKSMTAGEAYVYAAWYERISKSIDDANERMLDPFERLEKAMVGKCPYFKQLLGADKAPMMGGKMCGKCGLTGKCERMEGKKRKFPYPMTGKQTTGVTGARQSFRGVAPPPARSGAPRKPPNPNKVPQRPSNPIARAGQRSGLVGRMLGRQEGVVAPTDYKEQPMRGKVVAPTDYMSPMRAKRRK